MQFLRDPIYQIYYYEPERQSDLHFYKPQYYWIKAIDRNKPLPSANIRHSKYRNHSPWLWCLPGKWHRGNNQRHGEPRRGRDRHSLRGSGPSCVRWLCHESHSIW